jgi:hypothetical protein
MRVAKRLNEVVNRLNKTKREESVDLRAERERRDAMEREEKRRKERDARDLQRRTDLKKKEEAELRLP